MRTTRLRLAAVAASAAVLIGGVVSIPAGAEQRRVIVTLQGGRQVVLTLDVAPGAGVDASMVPDLGAPVISVADGGAVAPPAVTATTPPAPQTQPPATNPPATTPSTPTITTPPTIGTTPPATATPTTPTGTTGTTGVTPPTGTGATGPVTTGTGTTGTTPTTPTTPGTSTQGPAIGGVVKPKGQAKGEGSAVAIPRHGASARDARGGLSDALGADGGDPTTTEDDEVVPIDPAAGAQPTPAMPGYTVAPTLTTPLGVPNFFIEQFRIPPFLLPIYQAAGVQYGVPWQILAAINEIETDYGRNLSVSSAGALGWMQFMPPSWESYGVDANGDGVKDPYNPVDAIFAAGRYLKAAGADTDLERAIFAYNHADWYVQSVLLRARVIGGMPADVVGSLTGLTQGRFPVAARATYADSLDERAATSRQEGSNAAVAVEGDPNRRSINIYARRDAPVVAVNDGRIVKLGESRELGRFVVLEDVYGNRFTYSHLGSLAEKHPVPKPREDAAGTRAHDEFEQASDDARPTEAASDTARPEVKGRDDAGRGDDARAPADASADAAADPAANGAGAAYDRAGKERVAANAADATAQVAKERLFANPSRPAAFSAGGERQLLEMGERVTTFEGYFTGALALDPDDYVLKPLRKGSEVIAGTVLGRVDKTSAELAPHVEFAIRPAGRGAPRIDPKPILDGWKLLESTAIYKADDSLFGRDGDGPSIGQILLMSKEQLTARVLNDPNVEIYGCGRDDVKAGIVDRRVLATMEFLAASGLKPTISSLQCGHGLMTASGNVSEHSTGTAMDIAAINGITITPATQGEGSITDITVRRLLTLQGTMKPHQIITLMQYPGTDNTLALADHDDHIHVGFRPGVEASAAGRPRLQTLMKPSQWTRLVDQLRTIQNPVVPTRVSRYAIKAGRGE
jgi:murein DD-endopeptidase MepM/ murein hydrolase activator NlpD